MKTTLQAAIDELIKEILEYEKKIIRIKEAINHMCIVSNQNPMFTDIENVPVLFSVSNIRPDAFYGKALATACGEYLRMKNEPATAEEILDALEKGGFDFQDKGKEKFRLKNLAISLVKNKVTFVYFRKSKTFGLVELYPGRKKEKISSDNAPKVIEGTILSPTGKVEPIKVVVEDAKIQNNETTKENNEVDLPI